jgi:ribosomal-protein-alanine N-acetyltransferase
MIRLMLTAETDAVANLFAATAEAAHWSAQDLAQLELAGARVWVDVEDGLLAGAVALRDAVGEAEILNLAVGAEWRRRGIGRQLMIAALNDAQCHGVSRVFLEVRESSRGAQLLYSRLGFSQDGRRRNYYRDPQEDALLFSRPL